MDDHSPRPEGTGRGRWMALDVGTKRIGIAVSDPLKLGAQPLTTLQRSGPRDLARIQELAKEYEVERVLVGRPLRLSGDPSPALEAAEEVLVVLRSEMNVPVVWAEERLSSKEAERLMQKLRIPVAERRKRRDEFAAALILQWYLEEQSATAH